MIVFSHIPTKISDKEINVFGHLHNMIPKTPEEEKYFNVNILTENHKLVSCEFSNYMPQRLDKLVGM